MDIIGNDILEGIKFVRKNFNLEDLKTLVNEMSVVAWNNRMERSQLNRWLKNFNGNVLGDEYVEKIVALWLLMNYTFYTEREVRELCKCIFADYVHQKLLDYENNNFMVNNSIEERFQYIIDKTLFLPLGNPSESGTSLLYYFRQENSLSKKSFEFNEKISYENVVYIDDVTISGTQADTYIKEKEFNCPNKFILAFIATDAALDYLKEKQKQVKTLCAIQLDDRSKCFTSETFVFSGANGKILQKLAFSVCNDYGKDIFNCALGFDNGQQLFGFYYNTPDNTLPIIWSSRNNWIPAFPRYDKKYKASEVKISESKYL